MTFAQVIYFIPNSAWFSRVTFTAIAAIAVGMPIATRSLPANHVPFAVISDSTTIANEFDPPPGNGEPDGTVGLGLS